MRAIDPRIKIGVAGTIDENSWPQRTTVINPRTGLPANGWGAVVLAKLSEYGTLPDYWDFHWYSCAPFYESDNVLLQSASTIQTIHSRMRDLLSDYLGTAGETLPIMLTESNSVWMPAGRQSTSLTNALYLADFWGNLCKTSIQSFVWWNLHNEATADGNYHPSLYGWRNNGTFGILSLGLPAGVADPVNTRYPTFFAIKAISKFTKPGDTLVVSSTNNPLLSVYASKSAVNGRIKLMVVNKARNRDFTSMIGLQGYTAPTSAVAWRFSRTQDAGSQDLYRYQTSTQRTTVNGVSTVRLSFPRFSITVVEL
jgi:hypothetical protein